MLANLQLIAINKALSQNITHLKNYCIKFDPLSDFTVRRYSYHSKT